MRKVILFEMNEVPFRVLDDFVRRNPAGGLAAIMRRAKQLETVCEDQIELDPWTSWPTLHRGVIDEAHGVRHLGQPLEAADRLYPPLWEILARNNRSVGVFGSLHTAGPPPSLERYAFFVPDFFADSAFTHPPELRPFQALNLLMTRRSARNVDSRIPLRAALSFLREYARFLHWRTAATILAALVRERVQPHLKSRRRSLQPLIGLDHFLPLVRRTQPEFATFYTNHVAANLHRFWAAAFPEDSAERPMPAEWRRRYAGEIDYAMRILDDMLARTCRLAHECDYLLVVASSIGQAGVPGERTSGFTTITRLEQFMARMGIAPGEWQQKPAMVPCLSVVVAADKADAFEARLSTLRIGNCTVRKARREGTAPFTFDRSGPGSFHFYVYFDELDLARLAGSLEGAPVAAEELGLGFFRQEEGIACSGRHTPFGSLLVYDPRQPAAAGPRATVSTLQLAPALLANFGVPVPRYMTRHDPALLDVATPSPGEAVQFIGGGVEAPVTRRPPPRRASA